MPLNTMYPALPAEAKDPTKTRAWAMRKAWVFATVIPRMAAAFRYSKYCSPIIAFMIVLIA